MGRSSGVSWRGKWAATGNSTHDPPTLLSATRWKNPCPLSFWTLLTPIRKKPTLGNPDTSRDVYRFQVREGSATELATCEYQFFQGFMISCSILFYGKGGIGLSLFKLCPELRNWDARDGFKKGIDGIFHILSALGKMPWQPKEGLFYSNVNHVHFSRKILKVCAWKHLQKKRANSYWICDPIIEI